MPKFNVVLREVVLYTLVVEAEDEDDAEAVAEEVFVQCEDTNQFFDYGPERDAVSVQLVED